MSVTFGTLFTVRCLQVTTEFVSYQSPFSGQCLLIDVIKWLQFVNKLSITSRTLFIERCHQVTAICQQTITFRTLFTEWCHQVTAVCQQTIGHFQDTVYWAMPSSDCNLSTNYHSLSWHCSLGDAINWLSLLFTIQKLPASSVGPRQAVLPKLCRNLLEHLLWKFVLVLLNFTVVTSPSLEDIHVNLPAVPEFKIYIFWNVFRNKQRTI